MRLYTFEVAGQRRIGAELEDRLIDLTAAHAARLAAQKRGKGEPENIAPDMLTFLRAGEPAMNAARAALRFAGDQAAGLESQGVFHAFDKVKLCAPVPRPGKILASGINYRGHLEEEPGAALPEEPFFFSKLPSCVIGPGDAIIHPKDTDQIDYEVELAVIIGRAARRVPESEILNYVAGYTIHHDASARRVQMKDHQITLGKNYDTFAPMGPCLVTADEIPDPTTSHLTLKTSLNGQVMQDSSTADWVFPLPVLLAALNRVMTLEAGDVVSTGCPAGVGFFRHPQVFLKPGDVTRLEIEKIGVLENHVVME